MKINLTQEEARTLSRALHVLARVEISEKEVHCPVESFLVIQNKLKEVMLLIPRGDL